jgi:3-oxoacyl-[acyl-carrier protein] reductase
MKPLTDKTALITGGTRGIGQACAALFIEQGARVVICSRNTDQAEHAAALLGPACEGYGCDVTDSESVKALVETVVKRLGTLHILVNNAGAHSDGLLMRMKDEQWEKIIQTNLNSVFFACRAACRHMIKQRYGRIINIGSIVGLHGQSGQCNYAASKSALIGFTRSCARELASRNITANLVVPGLINTDMTAGMSASMRDEVLSRIPAGRAGTPRDVAPIVAFLASETAGYITGTVIPVDGGLGM